MTPRQWRGVVDSCLSGTFYTSQAFHGPLANRGGTIVNIASAAGTNALELHANYCAAKAGVIALTEVLALEWAQDDIRVFAVSPGFVATPNLERGLKDMPDRRRALEERTPLQRLLTIDEIAGAIVELSSSNFAYLTGTNVVIDGGWSIDGGGSRLFRPAPS
jgi:NAD(P)-dependent dehydrogenase (short-subunit alcohol dehydrogenase family)